MQTSFRSLLVALVVVLALGGCGKDDKGDKGAKPPSSTAQGSVPLSGDAPVDIINFEFKPQKVVVKTGTKVTWTNEDTTIHDITISKLHETKNAVNTHIPRLERSK